MQSRPLSESFSLDFESAARDSGTLKGYRNPFENFNSVTLYHEGDENDEIEHPLERPEVLDEDFFVGRKSWGSSTNTVPKLKDTATASTNSLMSNPNQSISVDEARVSEAAA
jgi:hypothetical protein